MDKRTFLYYRWFYHRETFEQILPMVVGPTEKEQRGE